MSLHADGRCTHLAAPAAETQTAALAESLSNYLSYALQLRDPLYTEDLSILKAKERIHKQLSKQRCLGTLIHDEKRYMLDKTRKLFLQQLCAIDAFVDAVYDTLSKLVNCALALHDSVLQLGRFVAECGFLHSQEMLRTDEFTMQFVNEHSPTNVGQTFVVGGIAIQIRARVAAQTYDWLWECEGLLCEARLEERSQDRPRELVHLFEKIAHDVGKKAALCDMPSYALNIDIEYATLKYLRQRVWCENTPVRFREKQCVTESMLTLQALRQITVQLTAVEVRQMHESHFVALPTLLPTQIASVRCIDRLCEHVGVDLLFELQSAQLSLIQKQNLVIRWKITHGFVAQQALEVAMLNVKNLLTSYNDTKDVPGQLRQDEKQLVTSDSDAQGRRVHSWPSAPFYQVRGATQWHIVQSPTSVRQERPTLLTTSRRVHRVCMCLIQMLESDGPIMRGGVRPSDALFVAQDATKRIGIVKQHVHTTRMFNNIGCELTNASDSLANVSGDFSDQLDKWQCLLSHFSTKDIVDAVGLGRHAQAVTTAAYTADVICVRDQSACDAQKACQARFLRQLTTQTLQQLRRLHKQIVPASYTSIAEDAMSILMPCILVRRSRLHVNFETRPHAMCDLLRTVPAFRKYIYNVAAEPPHVVKITTSDLNTAHPKLRPALEEYCKRGGADVYAHHLTTTGRYNREAIAFSFPSHRLYVMLRM